MELATGAIDGSNRTYSTSVAYVAGTVRAYAQHMQKKAFVTELGGTSFELDIAPEEGDLVYVSYRQV